MNGSAPNSPDTGSHVLCVQNENPNFRIERRDWRVSSKPMPSTINNTTAANTPVAMRKLRSSELRFMTCAPMPALRTGLGSLDLHLAERQQFLVDDRLRQRGIPQVGGQFLAVGQRPFHEVDHRFGALLVLRVLIQKDPGEGRERIRFLP